MHWSSAETSLREFAGGRGVDLGTVDPLTAVALVIDWYADAPLAGLDAEGDADMLLVEWGTYDWGEGPTFQYGICRQLVVEGASDDSGIWQLHVTHHFRPSATTAALAAGDRWCESRDRIDDLRTFVADSEASALVASEERARVEIYFESV